MSINSLTRQLSGFPVYQDLASFRAIPFCAVSETDGDDYESRATQIP